MYTINQVAKLAGVSTRTLRHYDRIGLLHPTDRTDANYRLYSEDDIFLLQQILLYKEMNLSLTDIKEILHAPAFQIIDGLKRHQFYLTQKQDRLHQLQHTVEQTIQQLEGGLEMNHEELFNGLKEQKIKDNEEQYGTELRKTYGDSVIDQSYQKMRKMSKWQWNHAEELSKEILHLLPSAMAEGETSVQAETLCKKHQEWIQLYWTEYTKEAHVALCKMYTEDDRFTAYYDAVKAGAAEFLYRAMKHYLA
jgi:DNA-binding transcriptional MerR regulator